MSKWYAIRATIIHLSSMRLLVILCCAMGLLAIQACKQGCTNPNAMNYDSAAKSEDGSCMYCDTSWQIFSVSNTIYVYDNNTSSPYYGSTVLQISLRNYKLFGEGNACAKLLQGDCTQFQHIAEISNLTDRQISLSGTLSVFYYINNGNKNASHSLNGFNISAYSTVQTDKIMPLCAQTEGFSFESYLNNYSISY